MRIRRKQQKGQAAVIPRAPSRWRAIMADGLRSYGWSKRECKAEAYPRRARLARSGKRVLAHGRQT